MRKLQENAIFFVNFLRDRKVAAAFPTSSFGVMTICRHINFAHARVIVEFGPGTGTISRELLKHMHPDAHLMLIESNPRFVRVLRKTLSDPRVSVWEGSAEDVQQRIHASGNVAADIIVSGIPFSDIKEPARSEIIRNAFDALTPNGRMITYQYRRTAEKMLRNVFPRIRRVRELRNLPPLWITIAEKD